MKAEKWIEIIGAKQHNLKNLNLKIPKGIFTVVTGPSGSGKSSLAFDTLFAEGQRRYMESLSTYARQFLEKQEKPDVEDIKGLTPTIAIEQKNQTKNSRSTVGTATEIYDYLRLIFAKMGTMFCPESGEPVRRDSIATVTGLVISKYLGQRALVSFPLEFSGKSKTSDRKLLLRNLLERGYTKAVAAGLEKVGTPVEILEIEEEIAKKASPLVGRASKDSKFWVVTDRVSVDADSRSRLGDALSQAYAEGFGRARILIVDEDLKLVNEGLYTDYPSTGDGTKRYPELTPLLFSFNSPLGACQGCKGFGNQLKMDPNLVIPNSRLSLSQGAIDPLTKPSMRDWLKKLLLFCKEEGISVLTPWAALPEKSRDKIWSGHGDFSGLEGWFAELEEEKYKLGIRVFLSRYRSPKVCTQCQGQRLRVESRSVLFHGHSISSLSALSVKALAAWFEACPLTTSEVEMGKDLFPQIRSRLDFLLRVGLDYLSMNRLARTLSGGEAQRIALANQLGSRLTQTTYVLDEPSIGLHPRDTERLIGILRDLRSLKNTVVVVEHDPDIIQSSEYLVDMGPEAGESGGEVLFAGTFPDFLASKTAANSLTHKFLTHQESVPVPMRRRLDRFKDKQKRAHWITLEGCQENNLKSVNLRIPLNTLTCITGVSGSGKSSAIRKTLYPALARILLQRVEEVGKFEKISGFEDIRSVLMIDQEPIGRSARSNPITFMKAFDDIRSIFASTMEARKKRYHAGHFSFNVPGGRCDNCEGDGNTRIEMVFMEDLFLKCDICEGKRYKQEILDIKHNGKNIHEVLCLTVSEARRFFAGETRLVHALGILEQVGLGYLRLGQASNTLSGGESQRLKIARELAVSDNVGTLYILDEPTTGLHFRDVRVLISVLHQLVERGNSVVVIEHNTDVMKSADWIVDFGPDGGSEGGNIVAEGTPEDVSTKKKSHTAPFLAKALKAGVKVPVAEIFDVKR